MAQQLLPDHHPGGGSVRHPVHPTTPSPEELSEEMKLKVLAIWQKSRMYNYLSLPVTIAEDVGMQTVGEVEARSVELDGMSIEQGYTRVYPKGDLAAHVIGYTSKISGGADLAGLPGQGLFHRRHRGPGGHRIFHGSLPHPPDFLPEGAAGGGVGQPGARSSGRSATRRRWTETTSSSPSTANCSR